MTNNKTSKGYARASDPDTSKQAAESIELPLLHICNTILLHTPIVVRPMTDVEIYSHLGAKFPWGERGVRHGRQALVEFGYLTEHSERGVNPSGRSARAWTITREGDKYLQALLDDDVTGETWRDY